MKGSGPPHAQRVQDALFVSGCSLAGLQAQLPLCWPTPPGTPPSPKKSYRSGYAYLGWVELTDPPSWDQLSGFDVLLRLVDFSGLRPVLAQLLGWRTGRGQQPFDPVSVFLLLGWQIVNRWSRAETLRQLQQPRHADYARRFGFVEGVYPSEGALRYFLTALGAHATGTGEVVMVTQDQRTWAVAGQRLNQLLAQVVHLVRAAGVVSAAAWEAALVCPDGQLHEAASRLRCQAVGTTCYQPTTPDRPRPCPAREKGLRGCDCATHQCAQLCKRATPRDPEARFVWYTGRNQDAGEAGEAHYGYRSLPLQLADRERRFSLTLLSDVQPANQHEEIPASALLLQLGDHYPDLRVDSVAGDAGLGWTVFLRTVYEHLQARRVVDLRGHACDRDEPGWVLRGYDDQGRPLCEYGYALRANGFDGQRRRHKWVCQQVCLQGGAPRVCLPQVCYPPPECPYQAPEQSQGKVVNVGACFGDGSWRLVRDVVVGSPTWKALYHRGRNAVEGRNATLEDWGLKRLPVYGLPRSKALLFLADVWGNLTTLARLIREATQASAGS